MKNIRVLLVTPHQDTRKRFTEILHGEDDIHLIAETGNDGETLEKLQTPLPDVVVMDLTLPDMTGERMTRELRDAYPGLKILALNISAEENSFADILEAGARGYLVMHSAIAELASAIRSVHRGRPYFCENCQEILMKTFLLTLNGEPRFQGKIS